MTLFAKSNRIVVAFLLCISVISGTTSIIEWNCLRELGMLARLDCFDGGDLPNPLTHHFDKPNRQINAMRLLLEGAGFSTEKTLRLKDILNLQIWIGNQVSSVASYSGNESGFGLIQLARNGKGMACGSMSQILSDALTALNMQARIVQLYRSNFNFYDTHMLVEVRLHDNRWVAVDPTFNVTYELPDGTALSVAEIQRKLVKNGGCEINPNYHGDRNYPARLDRYPLDWHFLFSNAYIYVSCVNCPWWRRCPPLRYWLGPMRYGIGDSLGLFTAQHNQLYFLVTVVLPIIFAISGGCAIYLLFRRR
jgi:hypothetical protein